MGRFSVEKSLQFINENTQPQFGQEQWPKVFPKETIGLELYGTIIKNTHAPSNPSDIDVLPDVLEAVKMIRLKGYKLFIFYNEPLISENKITPEQVDQNNMKLMEIFGRNGIFSIDGLFYSTSKLKSDIFALPNTGMIKRAEDESSFKFKGGYFVGDKLHDLKVADAINAKPVLIRTGFYEETETKLNTFSNRELKSKTKTFNSLLEFAQSLV